MLNKLELFCLPCISDYCFCLGGILCWNGSWVIRKFRRNGQGLYL